MKMNSTFGLYYKGEPYNTRYLKKLRHSTVEPVLGTLINFLAMKRVNTRGITLANKCMMMSAIAYNLKKMMKFKTNRPKAHQAWLATETDYIHKALIFLRTCLIALVFLRRSKISMG
jgi:hypothetical protein